MLDQTLLRQPMPHANKTLAAFFDIFLGEPAVATPMLVQRLERENLRALCNGVPTLADLAKRLAVRTRTLQRDLAAERTSLRAVVDDVRRDAARQHLANNMPLTDVSYLLGFRDTRSFFRAFKRWTGTTPLAWRAERAGRKRA